MISFSSIHPVVVQELLFVCLLLALFVGCRMRNVLTFGGAWSTMGLGVGTSDLCDVVNYVYIVIDRLVWHSFMALLAWGRYVCIIESFHMGWLWCVSGDLRRVCRCWMRVVCFVGLRIVDSTSSWLLPLATWETVWAWTQSCGFRRRFL